jgi:FkbM family methyltransferase
LEGNVAVVVELDSWRKSPTSYTSLSHPAGVILPFEGRADAELINPEIRRQIVSGAYSADVLEQIDGLVRPADRVLVIGAGLGTASTLVAKQRGVKRVIAAEANAELLPYLNRTHELNAVSSVETLHAVLVSGRTGLVPFYARDDIRSSSLQPDHCSWQLEMLVPCMDIDLILSEEQISLVICEIPFGASEMFTAADLSGVDRILFSNGGDPVPAGEEAAVQAILAERGFEAAVCGSAIVFGRDPMRDKDYLPANSRA